MNRTAVVNVVGLSRSLLGDATPNLSRFAEAGRLRTLTPVLPAVTCTVQSSMLTGLEPSEHGIVANGWYDRESAEIRFWKQSNRLVQGEKVWETAKEWDASFTCANMFWWYNMYSSVDWSVTPRPIYKADGRKLPDVYSDPPELRDELQKSLGTFPLFHFWGPASSIASSRWIADASMEVWRRHEPTLMLIYLPHLDYCLQKIGPEHPDVASEARAIDAVFGDLVDFFGQRGVDLIVVSEYGIDPVDDAVAVNRTLRDAGLVRVREEEGLELLDAGASAAFAVADHQVAHVYVQRADDIERVRELCIGLEGVAEVLDGYDGMHERAGELVLVADARRWFTYDYWLDDRRAPDFARTVDIHRKPGYDPRELFLDPKLAAPKLRVARRVLQKKLGFRMLMDVIPLDTSLVRGSHGRVDTVPERRPVLITRGGPPHGPDEVPCTEVREVILDSVFA